MCMFVDTKSEKTRNSRLLCPIEPGKKGKGAEFNGLQGKNTRPPPIPLPRPPEEETSRNLEFFPFVDSRFPSFSHLLPLLTIFRETGLIFPLFYVKRRFF